MTVTAATYWVDVGQYDINTIDTIDNIVAAHYTLHSWYMVGMMRLHTLTYMVMLLHTLMYMVMQ